jgi:hypothetical protein
VLPFEKIVAQEISEVDELRYQSRVCFNSNKCDISECYPSIPVAKHDEHQTRKGFKEEHDFKDYFYTSYLYRSIYDDSVERWLSVFPRNQSMSWIFILPLNISKVS